MSKRACSQWVGNVSEKEIRMLEAYLPSRYSFEREKATISVHLMDLNKQEKSILYLSQEPGSTMPKAKNLYKEVTRHGFVSFLVPGLGKERRLAIKSKVRSDQGSCGVDDISASVFF